MATRITRITEGTRIRLNIGGTMFETYQETLVKKGRTYFLARFASCGTNIEELFVDRSPRRFERILDYLRTGEIHWSESETYQLKKDAEFYEIAELLDTIKFTAECSAKAAAKEAAKKSAKAANRDYVDSSDEYE